MRLKSVFIGQYKNLRDFTLDFDGNGFIDIFVGKNGTGKSNLFEALIEIFRHLYELDKNTDGIGFEYKIVYEMNGASCEVQWKDGQLFFNDEQRKSVTKSLLPDNVLIYYSGHNKTVPELVRSYQEKFSKRIQKADFDESRRFIGIGSEYKGLLLAVLLLQKEDCTARNFVCKTLGIQSDISGVKLVLKRPVFAKKKFAIEEFDMTTHFWGTTGITLQFLNKLQRCIKTEFKHSDIYERSSDTYTLDINKELYLAVFDGSLTTEQFRLFDNLKTLDMLEDISAPVILEEGSRADISQFSDGQFQSVYIYSIIELFKDRNCITLLDEPDSFLHPEWQFEFLKQVLEITDTVAQKNHVLMSSHSALTLTSLQQSHLNVFEVLGNTVKVNSFDKDEVIKLLSGNRIFLSENESIMSISTYLKNSSHPVLFTEGISDEYVLEVAWKNLFPGCSRPFCIHNAFDRIFLRNLFSRDELKINSPKRIMFALFDFDEAYDDWNGLTTGCDEVTDPFNGLTKKLRYKYHYAMLLPVPKDDAIKKQVLNAQDKPWGKGSDSHLSIELLFFKEELIGTWFERCEVSGGGQLIEFKGDKVKFAREYVPSLTKKSFEVFRPMFEFIRSKCPAVATTTVVDA